MNFSKNNQQKQKQTLNLYKTTTSIPFLSSFLEKMKETKHYATEYGVGTSSIPIINAVMILFLISAKITVASFHLMQFVEDSGVIIPNFVYDVSAYAHMVLWGVTTLEFLPLMTKVMIRIESVGQKLVFALITRVDLYLWNRYRLQNPISQTIWKMQYKLHSLSVQNKHRVMIIAITALGLYALYRLGYL